MNESEHKSASGSTQSIHPLFDPHGLYREAGGHGVWDDGGISSVVEYFHAVAMEKRHQELRRAWESGIPEEPQDWGYGRIGNSIVHTRLRYDKIMEERRRQKVISLPPREPAYRQSAEYCQAADSSTALPPAGLVAIRLEPEPKPLDNKYKVYRDSFSFTGADQDGSRDAAEFGLCIPEIPKDSRCLVFLFEPWLIAQVAAALDRPNPTLDDDRIGLLCKAVSPKTLEAAPGEFEAARRAAAIATVLGFAPALYVIAGSDGIQRRVLLGAEQRTLLAGSIVLACFAPPSPGEAPLARKDNR